MRRISAGVLLGALALAGCVAAPVLSSYQPGAATVTAIKAAPLGMIAVGEFALAAGVKPKADLVIALQGAIYASPVANSFSQYLREAIIVELTAAKKYAPDSALVLTGQLVRNAGGRLFSISSASAVTEARFQVRRDSEVLFDKQISADVVWKSSFAADIAGVEATSQYLNLYGRLLAKLFTDPEFQRACSVPDAG